MDRNNLVKTQDLLLESIWFILESKKLQKMTHIQDVILYFLFTENYTVINQFPWLTTGFTTNLKNINDT